jgi:protein gp37
MGENSNIEWAHHTFNPWWGCEKIAPGCDHCYAEREAARFYPHLKLWGHDALRLIFTDKHWSGPLEWNQRAINEGTRYRVFCLSMGDVFDNHPIAMDVRPRLWSLIRSTPQLDWLLLTKRVGNAERMLPPDWGCGYSNVWFGYSPSSQTELDRNVPKLLRIPAQVHFLSFEPLLEQLDLSPHLWARVWGRAVPRRKLPNEPSISWVIVGGESGLKARAMHPDWVRKIRDDCVAAGVAFFFKQWGQFVPGCDPRAQGYSSEHENCVHRWDDTELGYSVRVKSKREAGRELDGRTWDMIP